MAARLWPRLFLCRKCSNVDKELTSMASFDRFSIKVVAGVGLCGAAIALSPDAAAAPLKAGGDACMQGAGAQGEATTGAKGEAGAAGGSKPIPVVKVIGGAPPTDSGPKQLTFHKGEKVRFEIETDEPFSFEIKGLNVKQSIPESSIISFKATEGGQFPVIATRA